MSHDVPAARPLAEVLSDVRIAMVMTSIDGVWSSRPLTCLEVDHSFLRFLVDASTDWVADLLNGEATVHATFSDPKSNSYVSLNGTAFVSADPAEVDRLWSAPAAAFFTGPDDPNVRVLQIDITDGQWWDGPSGRIGQTIGLLRAAINDDPSMAGDHGVVDV
ncbi:MAG: pyridoxamine 5'-phosphate oxidase family protein [Ilumatobacteraceae bacterium]|jgi:general stress protein 26